MITITSSVGAYLNGDYSHSDYASQLAENFPPRGDNIKGHVFISGSISIRGGASATVDETTLSYGQLTDIIAGFASGRLVASPGTLATVQARKNSL